MQDLYLFRHGLAVPQGTPGFEDDDRPLTHDGERRVRQVGRGLKRLGLKLVRIATSPLPRALRTAEIVAECLGGAELVEVAEELRVGRDARSIREWLATRGESRLMIVGHNPALSELITLLLNGPETQMVCDLRKAGVAALRGEPGGAYQVEWIARPRLFRS